MIFFSAFACHFYLHFWRVSLVMNSKVTARQFCFQYFSIYLFGTLNTAPLGCALILSFLPLYVMCGGVFFCLSCLWYIHFITFTGDLIKKCLCWFSSDFMCLGIVEHLGSGFVVFINFGQTLIIIYSNSCPCLPTARVWINLYSAPERCLTAHRCSVEFSQWFSGFFFSMGFILDSIDCCLQAHSPFLCQGWIYLLSPVYFLSQTF